MDTSDGYTDAQGKTHAATGQGRAITRGEEARVATALAEAWGIPEANIALQWFHADGNQERLLRAGLRVGISARYTLTDDQRERARRAGIVPGADGWWWAAAAAPVESPPPSWLTAAVLAALPCDGTPVGLVGVYAHVAEHPDYRLCSFAHVDAQCMAVLAALVASGEIEAGPEAGQWRRWGVPEGWEWRRSRDGASDLLCHVGSTGDAWIADANDHGFWWAYPSLAKNEQPFASNENGQAVGTPAAARTAALRACYERGVFGPRPVAVPATSTPPAPAPTRAEQVRLALLAVLTRGPVVGLANVLTALDGEGVQPAADGLECRKAAREVGAYIDGPRWSLPSVPHGWAWSPWQGDALFLAPVAATNVADASVAMASATWWEAYKPGPGEEVIEQHGCLSVEEGQRQALAAARRAGLFARPTAVETVTITGQDGTGPLPAVTSHGGKPTYPAPHGPLDAAVLAILATASCAEITAHLTAWGDRLIEQARESVVLYYAAERARMMGGRPEDFRDMSEVGEGPGVERPIPHAAVQASLAQRAYAADAPLLYQCWKAATTARDAYRAEGMSSRFSRSLVALWDLLDAAEHKPADPAQPCPACATAERRVAAVEGTCRELDDERAGLQRSLDAAIASATRAEAKLGALGAEIDALHARWAGAK